MKEATGEANMTIVTVALIGIITLIATPIVTSLVKGTKEKAECTNDGGAWYKGSCCYNPTYNDEGDVTGCTGKD